MRITDADAALAWLTGRGVTRLGPGRWVEAGPDAPVRGDDELAHEWTGAALADERLEPAHRLRIGLGLLDLLDAYWVTAELGWFVTERADPAITAALWAGYRRRLEAVEGHPQVTYSLWVDWFEDAGTAEAAFAAVLGDDVRRLRAGGRLAELAAGPLHRRAARVLECSGPVRWSVKHDVYEAAATVAELHPALFRALLAGLDDVYGHLEPAPALALLDTLVLPPGTEHVARLRKGLR
ncbi:hypothetical protein [Pseudosporangium ferrugineum]|uniref:Uncharacterized protein n=1 Tax=Pseudosporangium ferrugineum TaxID=439699 RepID=A0A2T0RNY6_9ACTN|nr:hypothetical protein [Pseudosporangium ferrugineum]PRY22916.1 hypothetical protein CLV70_116179 [Pseudosporangium ferrugineum]